MEVDRCEWLESEGVWLSGEWLRAGAELDRDIQLIFSQDFSPRSLNKTQDRWRLVRFQVLRASEGGSVYTIVPGTRPNSCRSIVGWS